MDLLRLGAGRVLRAATPTAIKRLLAARTSGFLALIGPRLTPDHKRLARRLRRAGWTRVMWLDIPCATEDIVEALMPPEHMTPALDDRADICVPVEHVGHA